MVIRMCAKTVQHLTTLAGKESWIRIGVEGGGCNGFRYAVRATSEAPDRHDEILSGPPRAYVGSESLLYLIGTEMRWTEDALGARIEFENPNAASSCGCGETFSI